MSYIEKRVHVWTCVIHYEEDTYADTCGGNMPIVPHLQESDQTCGRHVADCGHTCSRMKRCVAAMQVITTESAGEV
jgi:hypothetical protein